MKLAIVTPVFNDWSSFSRLVSGIGEVTTQTGTSISIYAIDDGSTDVAEVSLVKESLQQINKIEIVELVCNVGHQRAIAVGLAEVFRHKEYSAVLVMDSDGEDRPDDIPRLIQALQQDPACVVCATRKRRPGSLVFRIWYELYKAIFRLFTGVYINFGNFCLIPERRLETLVNNASIWNNLAATLTRSRIPLSQVPTDRGKRYAGQSKMNFVSLVIHGLSAIAVYNDILMIRLMLASVALSVTTGVGLLTVVGTRFLTDLAIPGWASSAAGLLTILLFQAVILFTIAALNMLNGRSAKGIIPRIDGLDFVLRRRKVWPYPANGA